MALAAQLVPEEERAPLTREFVAAGTLGTYFNIIRALPQYIDDLSLELGNDIYERMNRDPVLQGTVAILKTLCLSDGIKIVPSHNAPQKTKDGIDASADKKYRKSIEVRDFVAKQIDNLAIDINTTLEEMLDSLAYGNKIAELVWKVEKNAYVLKAIKPKHRQTTAFVCTPFNDVLGLIAAIPGENGPRYTTLFVDGAKLDQLKVIPREKFFVLTFRGKHGDPRGNSAYRSAYPGWWHKQQDLTEYAKYKGRFGNPLLWGTTPDQSGPRPMRGSDGALARDVQGRTKSKTAQEEMAETLAKADGSRAMAFGHGATVGAIMPAGEGSVFTNSIDLCNREMTTAVLSVTRATSEAEHGSKADSKTAQDMVGSSVAHIKGWLGQSLRRDVLYKIVFYEYGEKIAQEFTPRSSLTMTEPKDRANMVRAFSSAKWRACMNQYPQISEILGLDPPDLESGFLETVIADRMADSQQAIAKANAAAAPDEEEEDGEETATAPPKGKTDDRD